MDYHRAYSPIYPDREHIVAYLNSWFLANTKRKRNGKHGILQRDVKVLATDIFNRFRDGEESLLLEYQPSGSNHAIELAISSPDILWLQKKEPDPKSPRSRQLCEKLVTDTQKMMMSAKKPSRPSSDYKIFVTAAGNEHCFRLPFRSSNPSQLLDCDMQSTEISTLRGGSNSNVDRPTSRYFEHSLRDILGKNPIIINGADVNTLMPGRWLNDSIINFWMRWIGTPRSPNNDDMASQVHVFSSYFLSNVMLNSYSKELKRWLRKRKINIFEKKLLLFPFHGVGHWSLVAVYNPGLIKQTSRRWGDATYSNEVSCLIHFDSLGVGSPHSGRDIAWAVRLVLNSEWDHHCNTTLDKTSRPFTHRCLPLISAKVVCQDNGFDCGVFTCRYAFNAIELLKKRLTMSDVQNKLKHFILEDPLFNFTGSDITRMRTEIHNMLGSITEQFRLHGDSSAEVTPAEAAARDVAVNLFDDSDSDDDDDDDDVVGAFTNNDNDHSSDCSGSVWSLSSGELTPDEDLMYDSSGDTAGAGVHGDNRSMPAKSGSSTTLNTFLQLGDIIEYRDPSHKSLAKKGTITSIGALSTRQNIIGLGNGDWLHKGVHQVRRMSIKLLDQDGHIPNPDPVWKCLTKIIIITPYQDVDSDDEGEDDGMEEDKVYSWDHDGTAEAEPMPMDQQSTSSPTQPDESESSKFDEHVNANSWTASKKRKRTSCGQTWNSERARRNRVKREDAKLNMRRRTENYLCWAASDDKGKEYDKARKKKKVNEYDKAKKKVNELYVMSLQLGVVDKFYEKKIHLQRSKNQFVKQEKEFRRFLFNRKRSGAITLDVTESVDIQFMDNPKHGEMGRSRETHRSRRSKEEIITFEYKMRTLQVSTCCVCRENKLIFPKGVAKDMPKPKRNSVGDHICSICTKNKCQESNKYLKENLQPIWYERDDDGNFKLDDNGQKVVRYDIPEVLKSLTMAEKLLIRRCSPLIPSHHIRNGVYGINGHCVTFAQDIEGMCTELPQKESNMVIFVRNLSNRMTGKMHVQHFKVDKAKVLRALRWLKVHHTGYKDITIKSSNMDWIKEGSVYDVSRNYMLQAKKTKRDGVQEASETVSGNQCASYDDENKLSFSTVHPNTRTTVPTKEQGDIIRSLEEAAKKSKQKYDTLDFPPVDTTKPICEFDTTEQIFVNAYPWLFPGGIGDTYDPRRGKVKSLVDWAQHLLHYHDGRFLNDQMLVLYIFNMLQRHINNTQGNYFYNSDNFLGRNPPTVEQLQEQMRSGNFTYLSKLKYLAKNIRGSDSYWRGKTSELESWIDYHIGRGHGPPTHFITLSCAENWWPDLRRIMVDLESQAGNHDHAQQLLDGDFKAMSASAKRYNLYVNDFFMKRATVYLDTALKNDLGIKHYWARVEFAPGRGQIHLHLLAIGKNKSYLYDFYRAKTEEDKAKIMEKYATEVLGMTSDVDVDETHETDRSADSISPLKARFCESVSHQEDARMLCQECMVHKCDNYCLGDNVKSEPRQCRFEYGKETEYGKADTEGRELSNTAVITVDRRGIEHFRLRRTKSRKVVQHSMPVLQGWRANSDVQLLLYRSHPDKPDISEIENVCKYVVAYASKKNHTTKEEKEAIQNIIESSSSADIGGVKTLVKMSLNHMTSKRLIPIQEAVHEIDRMSLTLCSEEISYVSLASCTKLRKKNESKPKDLVYCYANRDVKYEHYSLDRYFYEVFIKESFMTDKDSGRVKDRILIANGLNCRPCHPIDYNYARGMLIMHKPWSVRKPLDTRNKQATIDTFRRMLEEKQVPSNVWTEYMRAVRYAQEKRIEVIAKQGVLDADVDLDEVDHEDAEQYLQWQNSTFLDDGRRKSDFLRKGEKVDIGIDYDWSVSSFAGERDTTVDGDVYTQQLREDCKQLEIANENNLTIPTRSDGSKYSVDILSDEQRIIVLAVIDTVVKFLTNHEDYEPLRATVVGCGGCGKSLIINTIITIIRELTNCNSSVKVAAPSGCAAYNVGGCTLHRLLDINVQVPWKSLNEKMRSMMKEKLSELLVFMTDERSMLNSEVVFGAEEHMRECVYNGHNTRERWGGVPVVLFFGDDYQLPPTDRKGVINGFTKYYCDKSPRPTSYRSKNGQICDYEGIKILTEMMTQKVFMLTKNFRASKPEDNELMSRLRVGEPTEADAERLMNLHLNNYSSQFKEELENDPRCLWAFAKREDMNKKNTEMLVKTHKRNNTPVARLTYVANSTYAGSSGNVSHFYGKNIIPELDICVGAQVCLETANIEPSAGLFVGAIGRVVEIVYDKSVGPNTVRKDHLPKYVVVDIPSFKPPPGVPVWDRKNPTHVPITPFVLRCNRCCCTMTFMPMKLAYAITIHRCQGLEAGFSDCDRWTRMIMDPSDISWEIQNCCGTLYVATSRGKTLGSKENIEWGDHPQNSAIHWTGPNISTSRILDCAKKRNGQLCEAVIKRERWVDYLKKRAAETKETYNEEMVTKILTTTYKTATEGNLVPDRETLMTRISNIIKSPNDNWSAKKQEWELPRTYFDG